MKYTRSAIERESPEQYGYDRIKFNLSESSVTDLRLSDLGAHLGDITLAYGDHLGMPALREAIVAGVPSLDSGNVLVTPGAAAALFIINTSLLEAGDHALIEFPNYVTNLDTPRTIGAVVERVELRFENGFRHDTDALIARITPATKLVSITTPHNPTGSVLPEADLRRLIAAVERSNAYLLVDETYRDMTYVAAPPLAASLSPRAISVSSLSKSYGLPGLRMGWLICRDAVMFERFLAAKEQIFIGTSLIDEALAHIALQNRQALAERGMRTIRQNLGIVRAWARASPHVEWVEPQGGCVCFPRIKPGIELDWDRFYHDLLHVHGTYVGPGHWFGMDRRYMRVGFGWITPDVLEGGLQAIDDCVAQLRSTPSC